MAEMNSLDLHMSCSYCCTLAFFILSSVDLDYCSRHSLSFTKYEGIEGFHEVLVKYSMVHQEHGEKLEKRKRANVVHCGVRRQIIENKDGKHY